MAVEERVIFEINKLFDVSGVSGFIKRENSLYITNLGNIFIASGKEFLTGKCPYMYYDFEQFGIKFNTLFNDDKIVAGGFGLQLFSVKDNKRTPVRADIKFVLDKEEFDYISKNLNTTLFISNEQDCVLSIDGLGSYAGILDVEQNRFVILRGQERFEIYYKDIKKAVTLGDSLELNGLFYFENYGVVAKRLYISKPNITEKMLVGSFGSGYDYEIDSDAIISFAKMTSYIGDDFFENREVFVSVTKEKISIVDRDEKKVIAEAKYTDVERAFREDIIALVLGDKVVSLRMDELSFKNSQLGELKSIKNDKIAFNKNRLPLIVDISENHMEILLPGGKIVKRIKFEDIDEYSLIEEVADESKFVKIAVYINDGTKFELIASKILSDQLQNLSNKIQNSEIEDNSSFTLLMETWGQQFTDFNILNIYKNIFRDRFITHKLKNISDISEKQPEFRGGRDKSFDDKINNLIACFDSLQEFKYSLVKNNDNAILIFKTMLLRLASNENISLVNNAVLELEKGLNLFTETVYNDLRPLEDDINALGDFIVPVPNRKFLVKNLKENDFYRLEYRVELMDRKIETLFSIIINREISYLSRMIKNIFDNAILQIEDKVDRYSANEQLKMFIKRANDYFSSNDMEIENVKRSLLLNEIVSDSRYSFENEEVEEFFGVTSYEMHSGERIFNMLSYKDTIDTEKYMEIDLYKLS